MSRSFSLNRRTFLNGAGVAMALPWLEATGPSTSDASTQSVTEPRRLVLINLNLGLYAPAFFPENVGKDYTPSEYLKLIQEFRNEFTVISGLSHPGVVGGHAAEYRILNGTPSNQKLGISLDQFAAKSLGRFTRFDTLPIGMGNTNLSWTSTGSPVPAESRMALVFDRMFGDDGAASKQAARRGLKRSHSVLDMVNGQAGRMKPRISQTDRQKLDEFFTSVREVERRLQKSESWLDTPKPKVAVDPPVDPRSRSQFSERVLNLFDMAYLAVETDSTRIVTFNIFEQNAVAIEGVNNGYHNLSHHGKDPENVRQLKLIEKEILKQLKGFLSKLKETREDDGNLLERTAVLLVSSLGNASNHSNKSLPVLLAGGRFEHGQHLRFDPPDTTPLCNAFVSILQQLGIQADSFSTSTGPLDGLQWA